MKGTHTRGGVEEPQLRASTGIASDKRPNNIKGVKIINNQNALLVNKYSSALQQ